MMCLSNMYTLPKPQLCDAAPLAEVLRQSADLCSHEQLALAAKLRRAADMIVHVVSLLRELPTYDIDKRTRQIVAATLAGVRALAETERQAGNSHWTRAVLLIDQAIEELGR